MHILTFGGLIPFLASQKCVWNYHALRLIYGRLIRWSHTCNISWAMRFTKKRDLYKVEVQDIMNVKDVFPKFSAILSEVSKTKNGIMVELYSALICYPLIRIMIAIAAKKSKVKITEFNFKKKR